MSLKIEEKFVIRLANVEAALYSAGRPVDIESLKGVANTKSETVIRKLIMTLANRYEERGSALEIRQLPQKRAVMQLRPEFTDMVRRFTNRPLLTSGPLKTLSFIAYHQPIEQVKVVEDRGSHAYSHLKMMEDMGLILRDRISHRTVIIKTTCYFAEYFGFSDDPIKSKLQLRSIFSSLKITKLDNGDHDGEMESPITVPNLESEAILELRKQMAEGGIADYPRPSD